MSDQAGFPGGGPNEPMDLTSRRPANLLPKETKTGKEPIGYLPVTLPDGRQGAVPVFALTE